MPTRAALALLLLLLFAYPAAAEDVQVVATYTVEGGVSLDYTPLSYEVDGGVSLDYTSLVYQPDVNIEMTKPVAASFKVEGEFTLESSPYGYSALAGFSLDSKPLLYALGPQVYLGNATFTLRVHVRIMKDGEVHLPDFDVEYAANGTSRVAVKGEDVLSVFYSWVELLQRDPLVLEFPQRVGSYVLYNSTPMLVDPRAVADVYVYYYYGPAPPTKPPPQPPEEGEEEEREWVEESPLERQIERTVSEGYWAFKRFLAWVQRLLEGLVERPLPLFLLLLGLALVALALASRRREKVVLVFEVKD